jgi:flavin-dependent dehydrogenase
MIIVGGGSAGLYLASLIKNATVIEEHRDLGKPVQCTGVLTNEIERFLTKQELRKIIINKIHEAEVHSPNNKVRIKLSTNYIIDNVDFIKLLAKKAEKNKAEILTGYKYLSNNKSELTTDKITLKANYIIGADGPLSTVAKNNGLFEKREFLTGVQARVRIKSENIIKFYPYIGEYAWSVPEDDDIARIGVAARSKAREIFDAFIKKFPGKIIEIQGGVIPMYKPGIKVKQNNTYIIGDAAAQIKNTTGGGIIPGLKAARILSKSPDYYEKNIKELNKELYIHYLINKILRKFTDKDWDSLINDVKDYRVKSIIKNTNRDNAKKMIMKLLVNKPSLLKYGLKLF